jgi:hypothetical protein
MVRTPLSLLAKQASVDSNAGEINPIEALGGLKRSTSEVPDYVSPLRKRLHPCRLFSSIHVACWGYGAPEAKTTDDPPSAQ